MQIGCVIQARLGSTRLPRKVLADIGGWPMLKHVVNRLGLLRIPIVVATPPGDTEEIVQAMPEVFRDAEITAPNCGPEDLLRRHLLVGQQYGWDAVMRVTSDCPLIDPFACKEVLDIFQSGHYDYVANDIPQTYPNGMGCEVIRLRALLRADFSLVSGLASPDREHVSSWIIKNIWPKGVFPALNVTCPIPGVKGLKFSVDTQADLDRVIKIDRAKPTDYSLAATLQAYNRVMTAECKELMRLDQ